MLEKLLRQLRDSSPEGQLRGLTQAFHLGFLSLGLLGVPLGLLYWLTRPAPYPWSVSAALTALAALLASVMLWRSRPTALTRQVPAERLSSALQVASAPGVSFLLGCAAFHDPKTWLGCWLVAAAAYLLARRQLAALLRT